MLIHVTNGGEVIAVHPLTLAAHEALGWVQCEAPQAEPQPEPLKADTNGNAYLSVSEIRAALDERGISYDPKAKRTELLALLKG